MPRAQLSPFPFAASIPAPRVLVPCISCLSRISGPRPRRHLARVHSHARFLGLSFDAFSTEPALSQPARVARVARIAVTSDPRIPRAWRTPKRCCSPRWLQFPPAKLARPYPRTLAEHHLDIESPFLNLQISAKSPLSGPSGSRSLPVSRELISVASAAKRINAQRLLHVSRLAAGIFHCVLIPQCHIHYRNCAVCIGGYFLLSLRASVALANFSRMARPRRCRAVRNALFQRGDEGDADTRANTKYCNLTASPGNRRCIFIASAMDYRRRSPADGTLQHRRR